MTVGMVKGRGSGRDWSGRDTAQILRKNAELPIEFQLMLPVEDHGEPHRLAGEARCVIRGE